MMKILVVDAFTSEPFSGNPAAVCLLPPEGRDDRWMQSLAAEMNLAETAFLAPEGDAWRLRWFTPELEVNLCGHATLASAHALGEWGLAGEPGELRFLTRSGVLRAVRLGAGIRIDLPADPAHPQPLPADIARALGGPATVWTGASRANWLVCLPSDKAVQDVAPDFRPLRAALLPSGFGVIVTSAADRPGVDFVSRYFAPAHGIDEDPVTGSAHCALAPYWSGRLGRTTLAARQISRRGGALTVELAGERVLLTGRAVTVLRGEVG